MRLNILSPVQHSHVLLSPGATVHLPEELALSLIRAKAAEPAGPAALAAWALHAAADLTAQQREEAAQAGFGAVLEIPYIGGHSRARVSFKGDANV